MRLTDTPLCVDSFSEGAPGLLFFCSHAHEDHLSGLHALWARGELYSSPTTCKLLELRWPTLRSRLRPLELRVEHVLTGLEIGVTLLDAHHVPGAVMFIFRGFFGTIIHTGDFRLHREHMELASMPALRDGLTHVYLDNTFCHPRFDWADREVVLEQVVKQMSQRWPCVLFVAVYKLGKECLLQMLGQRLQARILVSTTRARTLLELDVHLENCTVEPCSPAACSLDTLWQLSMSGVVWAVSRNQVHKAVDHVASNGIPAFGVIPSGWASSSPDHDTEDAPGAVAEVPYSDHCSFLELVQFLWLLPSAPVTLISPVPQGCGRFSYDGEEGLRRLAEEAGVSHAVTYQPAASR